MTLPLQISAHNRIRYLEVDTGFDTPCWMWQLGLRGEYPVLTVKFKKFGAHRWFYEQLVGPIPEGCDIHHHCEQKLCVNPAHMSPVTEGDHVRIHFIGRSFPNRKQPPLSSTCGRGHAFTKTNTYRVRGGGRRCRACDADAYQRRRARSNEEQGS